MAVLGIPAGAIVHKLGPKASMLLADGARAPIVAAVPFLHATGALTFPLVRRCSVCSPARTSPASADPPGGGRRGRAVARAGQQPRRRRTTNITTLLGPALAGVLIALVGAANVMWFDAVSFLIAFALIASSVRVVIERHDDEQSRGVWVGLAYLRRDLLVARVAVGRTFALFPMLVASFPVLAYEQFHQNARVAGLLLSVIGAGQVVGSFFAFRLAFAEAPADANGGVRPCRDGRLAVAGSCPTCRSRSPASLSRSAARRCR